MNNEKGNQFLSGFRNDNIIEDVYTGDSGRLKPGAILSENDRQYKIEIGIPFIRMQHIEVETESNKIIVTGKRHYPDAGKEKSRNYKGIFQIPVDALMSEMNVSFDDGMLIIKLPKNKIIKQFQSDFIR